MAIEWSAAYWPAAVIQVSVAVAAVTVLLGYAYSTYHYGKWNRLGVPHADRPTPLLGHLADTIMGRMALINLVHAFYGQFDGCRYFGIYEARKPLLVLRDPELVHSTLVGDFTHFYDRNANKVSFKHDKLFDHLANLRGEQWKAVRAKLSPTFSSAKLKSMVGDMNECTERLIENLNGQITRNI
ncbi:Cytochrome P450, partial [Cinara cedri]